MNITELARILKITPQELRDSLPRLGFDIGQKAIKINRNTANKIIKEWPSLKKQLEKQTQADEAENAAERKEVAVKKSLVIEDYITVRDFASLAGLPVKIVLSELMKNSIFASLNEKIDFETAWLVGSELGLEIKRAKTRHQADEQPENKLKQILAQEKKESLRGRPPVIVVMGHVDHGKTKLLDAIRKSDVVASEAGGITQHIGAYQVARQNKLITFIDTPGHEAFTAMRGRGAKIADIAVLVVAADDGVKPQTIEAYRIIEASKIPFIVAINKIDKPEANIEKTKQELSSQLKIIPEDWGGKTICAPISALNGTGIDELLDMVLLIAEAESDHIKANQNAPAIGTVIESHIDKGAGPVATILVQNGTLRLGDELSLGNFAIGKVKSLIDFRGQKIKQALPSAPVQIIGLKTMPQVGDILQAGAGGKIKFKKNKSLIKKTPSPRPENENESEKNIQKINLIIKSDVLGSAEAIEESLEKINTEKIKVDIIRKGLGNITDGDIKEAEAANAQIIGFNVKLPPAIEDLAREKNISIKIYNIIYDLINDIKEQMQKIVEPTVRRVDLGRLKVLAIFKTEKDSQIIGGKIINGRAEIDSLIEVIRNQKIIASGKLSKLQSAKQDVTSCEEGQECGIEYIGEPIIKNNDFLNFYKEKNEINKI